MLEHSQILFSMKQNNVVWQNEAANDVDHTLKVSIHSAHTGDKILKNM